MNDQLAGNGENDGSGGDGPGSEENNEGPTAFLPLYTSGSRLQAITVGEAGSAQRHLVGWYDTELGVDCGFRYAEDGRRRCLPQVPSLSRGFADAACTEAIYYDGRATPCTARPPYRLEGVGDDGCGWRVIRIEQVARDEVYHESCSATPLPLSDGATVWRDVETLDPTVFVAGTEHERLNAAGFGVIEIRGDDGSREVTGMLDGTYGWCSSFSVAGGATRCAPAMGVVDEWWYSDEGCSETPLAFSMRNSCGETLEPSIAFDSTTGNTGSRLVLIGPPLEEGTVYEGIPVTQACEAVDVDEVPVTFHPVLGPFDAEQLHLVSRTTRGEGRIRIHHNAIDGVLLTPVAHAPLFDTELDAPCAPMRTAEGGWLCMPEVRASVDEVEYADPDCSEVVVAPTVRGIPDIVLHVERDFCSDLGDVVLAAYEATGSYTGPRYALNPAGACQPSETDPINGYWTARPLEFARLEETRE